MTPDFQRNTVASWDAVTAYIEQYPDDSNWGAWKKLARKFIREGISLGLNQYFRAGQGMHHLLFSTLDHHGLLDEPRVTVVFHPEDELRIIYSKTNLHFHTNELECLLPYAEGFSAFKKNLSQLWTATVSEPLPDELRQLLS